VVVVIDGGQRRICVDCRSSEDDEMDKAHAETTIQCSICKYIGNLKEYLLSLSEGFYIWHDRFNFRIFFVQV
jgi:hypothetical protein